ncbi:integrase core domain-containing protein [Limnobacter sp.]|uniref:integrase core domain-containing protein n=1 Tax=Limnobacter sp. TaxID=2003368 RepID=UPI003BAC1736
MAQLGPISWCLTTKTAIKWRQHCNAVRPHSSLNYLTPNEFVAGLQNNLPTETRELSSQW